MLVTPQARARLGRDLDSIDAPIYVAPKAQGRGVGRLLMCHALQRLRAADMRSLFLWALRDNRIGAAFYEGLGGRVLREVWSESNQNFLVVYGWDDLDALMEKTCRQKR